MKNFLLPILLILLVSAGAFGQEEKIIRGGIVNGKAINLPKPAYSQEAKDFCASGKVEVEVLIGEDGKVIEAKAVSGDELLRASAVEAAKKAVFYVGHITVKVKGILVYNFVPEQKCVEINTPVNKRALFIPKPKVANLSRQIKQEEIVKVIIIVEISTGKVLRARAVSGSPLLHAACEDSASQVRFSPVNDVPFVPTKATLVYKFKPNGKIEF